MKRIATALIAACTLALPAFADKTVTVRVPAAIPDKAAAEAYTTELLGAVNKVCREETAPMIGSAYYAFRGCVKDTRADVAKADPTGLLASRLGVEATVQVAGK